MWRLASALLMSAIYASTGLTCVPWPVLRTVAVMRLRDLKVLHDR
jgi:hypothetical protein